MIDYELLKNAGLVVAGVFLLMMGRGKWPADPSMRVEMRKGDWWGYIPTVYKWMGGFMVVIGLGRIAWRLVMG